MAQQAIVLTIRRTIAVGLFLLAAGLVFLWSRSSSWTDFVHVRFSSANLTLISGQGTLIFHWNPRGGRHDPWTWDSLSYRVNATTGYMLTGVGRERSGEFWAVRDVPKGGGAVAVPYWLPVLTTGLVCYVLTVKQLRQFSLRNLLVVVTLVAGVFGLHAWF